LDLKATELKCPIPEHC